MMKSLENTGSKLEEVLMSEDLNKIMLKEQQERDSKVNISFDNVHIQQNFSSGMKHHDGTRDSDKGGESTQNDELQSPATPAESRAVVISSPEPEIRMQGKPGSMNRPAEFALTLPTAAQQESLFASVTDAEIMQLI